VNAELTGSLTGHHRWYCLDIILLWQCSCFLYMFGYWYISGELYIFLLGFVCSIIGIHSQLYNANFIYLLIFLLLVALEFWFTHQSDLEMYTSLTTTPCLNSIPELVLINLELEFPTTKFNPQINLLFNFLIQKYFLHDNPTWNINYLE